MIQYMSSVRLEINNPKIHPVIGSEAKNPLPVSVNSVLIGLSCLLDDDFGNFA